MVDSEQPGSDTNCWIVVARQGLAIVSCDSHDSKTNFKRFESFEVRN